MKNYEAYYYGYDENGKHQPGYTELIEELGQQFPLGQSIIGEQNQKDFIRLFGSYSQTQEHPDGIRQLYGKRDTI
nr:hypothetical protein [uncultured Sphaerochaeta sp.]